MENHPYIHWQSELQQLFDPIEEDLRNASAIYILTDENVHTLWMNTLLENCSILQRAHIIEIPAGESSKEWEIASQVMQQWMEDQADRHIWLINLGGGVITDLGGWIACNYKRGISFVNVPTTLMGMVDASIGGKNGINFMGNKNMIGTFQEPDALLIYPGFIETLPEQELLSGFAEMIKHALIADQALWEAIIELEEIDAHRLIPFIKRNIQIKNHIVFEDPFEEGSRKLLNYGHTLGHALESWSLAQNINWSHGYCVAQGMKFANFLSWKKGLLDEKTYVEVNEFLEEIYPSNAFPSLESVVQHLKQDKKNQNQHLQFVLLENIELPLFNQSFTLEEIQKYYTDFLEISAS